MTDVAALLAEYVDELNAGRRPEAALYIQRADTETERRELAAAIEGVLVFSAADVRHPRDAASGKFVAPGQEQQISEIVNAALGGSGGWPVMLPRWRAEAGLTIDDVADRALATAGIPATVEHQTSCRQWLAAMEAGTKTAAKVSDRAMRAVAKALNVRPAEFVLVGRELEQGEGDLAVAFRDDQSEAIDADTNAEVARRLDAIADELVGAVEAGVAGQEKPPATGAEAVDVWFSTAG